MKTYIYCFSVLLFCFACAPKTNTKDLIEELPTKQILKVDTIGTFEDEFLFAKEFLVYNDSVLIVLNKAYQGINFIECYDLVNKKHIRKLFRYGNGPNEMLSARVHLNNNNLYVNDYIKAQIAIINIDSLIISEDYDVKILEHKAYGLPTAVICNNKFILENPYYFNDEKLKINQGKSRFISTNGNKPYEYSISYPYNTRNVSVDGCIITNDNRKRIIYASMHNPDLELYDYNLNVIKVFNRLPELEAEYLINGIDESNEKEIIFRKNIPYAYLDYTTDNEYVYLVYMGSLLRENTAMKDYPNWILKFDWDCNLLEKYYINAYILSVSKSTKNDTFYITILNEEENPLLLKLQHIDL